MVGPKGGGELSSFFVKVSSSSPCSFLVAYLALRLRKLFPFVVPPQCCTILLSLVALQVRLFARTLPAWP
jgi:hypothetical protein